MIKKTIINLLVLFALFLPMISAQAQGILPTETGINAADCPYEEGCSSTGNYSLNDFVSIAVKVSDWILGIVGSLTLLMFIYGGVTLIISAGNQESVKRGKEIIIAAVIGLVIVFSAYTIIQFALTAMGFQDASKWSNTGEGLWK